MKTIKLKVTETSTKSFAVNTLIKARVDDEGNISTTKYCTAENKKKRIMLSIGVSGEIFGSNRDGSVFARFVELKTKNPQVHGAGSTKTP